jgi:hypothetical protein
MKTIKTKKSVGIFYVTCCYVDDNPLPFIYESREAATKSREWDVKECIRTSEISEVELFETIEEQVPEIGRAWVFFYKALKSEEEIINSILCEDEGDAIACRKRYVDYGYECSKLREVKEEF